MDPATEVLAQNNTYYNFVVGAPTASEFDLPAACDKQVVVVTNAAAAAPAAARRAMSLFGRVL